MSSNGLMASSTPPSSNSGPKASGNSLCKNYEQQSHMNINKGCSGGTTHGTTSVNSSNRDTSTPPDSSSNATDVQNQAQAHPPHPTSNDTTPNDTTTTTTHTTTAHTTPNTHTATATATTTHTTTPNDTQDTQDTHGTEPYNESNTESSRDDSSRNNDQYRSGRGSGRRSSSYRSKDSSVNSSSTDDTEGSNTSQNSDMLDFAKRDISKHCGRASYSQLSSLTQNSPEHIIEPVTSVSEEPVYQADDHVRITNPASAALSRMPEAEQIGFHEPFGDNSRANSRSGSTSSSGHSPKTGIHRDGSGGSGSSGSGSNPNTGSSDGSTNPTTNSTGDEATGLLSSRNSPITLQPYVPKRSKPYEPARVVLHKSELNAPYGSSNNGGSGGSDTNSDISSTLNNSQSSVSLSGRNGSTISLNGLRNGSVSDIVPQSLVRSLAGSPEGPSINGPIKHIREPKQPIYIPAVLRPTEEASYDLGSPQGNTSQGSISSSSTLPGSAAVLHSQKPVTRHWVPDQKAKKCNTCDRDFTWYRRRHHCRKCGGVFCADDANKTIGLDRVLNYNVLGVPCKSCDKCASEFAAFCHDSPRLNDNTLAMQQPVAGPETEELDVGSGGDWSTF